MARCQNQRRQGDAVNPSSPTPEDSSPSRTTEFESSSSAENLTSNQRSVATKLPEEPLFSRRSSILSPSCLHRLRLSFGALIPSSFHLSQSGLLRELGSTAILLLKHPCFRGTSDLFSWGSSLGGCKRHEYAQRCLFLCYYWA